MADQLNYNPEEIKYEDEQAGVTAKKEENWNGFRLVYEFLPGDCRYQNRVLTCAYGFIKSVMGNDGMSLDCYIGEDLGSPFIFRVTQTTSDGAFDEYKFMIGFEDQGKAEIAYLENMPESMYGGITWSSFAEMDLIRKEGKNFYIDSYLQDLRGVFKKYLAENKQFTKIDSSLATQINDNENSTISSSLSPQELDKENVFYQLFSLYLAEEKEKTRKWKESEKAKEEEKKDKIKVLGDSLKQELTLLDKKRLEDAEKLKQEYKNSIALLEQSLEKKLQEIKKEIVSDNISNNTVLDLTQRVTEASLGSETSDDQFKRLGINVEDTNGNQQTKTKEIVYFDCLKVSFDEEDIKLLTDSRVRAKILVTQANEQNLNNREYSDYSLIMAVEKIQPYIRDGVIFGYEEHPEPVFNDRNVAVGFNAFQNPVLFKVVKMWYEYGKVYAIAEFLDNVKGNLYSEKIKRNETVSVSLRALGECITIDGVKKCDIDAIHGFDVVGNPAMRTAKVLEYQNIEDSINNSINNLLLDNENKPSITVISCLDCDKELSDKIKSSPLGMILGKTLDIKSEDVEKNEDNLSDTSRESHKVLTKLDDLSHYKGSENLTNINNNLNNKTVNKVKEKQIIEDFAVTEETLMELEEAGIVLPEEVKREISCYLAGKNKAMMQMMGMDMPSMDAKAENKSELETKSEDKNEKEEEETDALIKPGTDGYGIGGVAKDGATPAKDGTTPTKDADDKEEAVGDGKPPWLEKKQEEKDKEVKDEEAVEDIKAGMPKPQIDIKPGTDGTTPTKDGTTPTKDEKDAQNEEKVDSKEDSEKVEDSKDKKEEEALTEMCKGKEKIKDSISEAVLNLKVNVDDTAIKSLNDKIKELADTLKEMEALKNKEKQNLEKEQKDLLDKKEAETELKTETELNQEIVDKIEENLSETNINNNIETNNLETQSIMDTNKEQELLKRLQSMLDEKDAKEKADSLKNEVKTFISDSVDNNKILGVNLDVLSIGQRNAIKDEVGKDAETLDEARKLLKLTAKVFVDKELELKQKTRLAGLKPTNSFVGKTVEYVTDNKSWLEYFDKLDKAVDNSRNEYRKSKVNNVKEYADVNLDFTNRILSDWDQSNSAELASADREQRQAIKDGWISDAAVVVSNSDFKNQPIIARVIIKQIFQRLTTMQLVQGLGPGKGEGSPGPGGGPFGAEFKFPYWYYTEPTHNPKRYVSDNGPIPETTSGIGFESFYARLRAIGFSVPVNLRKQLEEGALGIDPVAIMLEAISDDIARAIDTHLLEEHQQTCDEYNAVPVTSETPVAGSTVFSGGGSAAITYDGGTVTYGTTVTAVIGAKPTSAAAGGIPIVQPRQQYFLNANGTTNNSTIDNNIIVTFPNTNTTLVRGVLDSSLNIVKEDPNDATPNYAVDFERGYFVFNSSSGIAANGDLANTRLNYSYATNYVNFDLDLAANTLAEDYYNGLLNLMAKEAGIMCMSPRFVRPDMFLLPASIAQGAIGISGLFHQRKSPVDTFLNKGFAISDILGGHNNIAIMQTNGRMFAGDRRGILFQRYMVGYGVQTPAALDGPHNNMYAPSGGGNVQLTPGHKWALHVRDVVGTPLPRTSSGVVQNHPGRTIRFLGTLAV